MSKTKEETTSTTTRENRAHDDDTEDKKKAKNRVRADGALGVTPKPRKTAP